jgi:hypothetical protein
VTCSLHSYRISAPGRRTPRARCRTLVILLLSLITLSLAYGQTTQESPVFKKKKNPEELPEIRQSDPLYEIWQTFLLTRQANAGDAVAQYELGIRYFLGIGAQADTAQAAYWTAKSAEQNHLPARFNLAILAYHGMGVKWNPFEAYRQLTACAVGNMVEAEYFLSLFYLENLVVPMNWDTVVYWLKKAADGEYAPAKELLPKVEEQRRRVHERESGDAARKDSTGRPALPNPVSIRRTLVPVTMDTPAESTRSEDLNALLRSALQGATEEQKQSLGLSKMLDSNIKADSTTFAAIAVAAGAGSPEALVLLGRKYEQGIASTPDVVLACSYYVRAIRMDSPRAPELLWNLLQRPECAAALKTRAGARDPEALCAWATILALGMDGPLAQQGVVITQKQAVQFLEDAASQGSLPALVELGLWYYTGRWVGLDPSTASRLWQEARQKGSREADIRLAIARLRESGTEEDLHPELEVLSSAMREGSVLAEFALGYCLESGTGVGKDVPRAARLYRDAAGRGSQDAFRALRRMHDEIRPAGDEFRMTE